MTCHFFNECSISKKIICKPSERTEWGPLKWISKYLSPFASENYCKQLLLPLILGPAVLPLRPISPCWLDILALWELESEIHETTVCVQHIISWAKYKSLTCPKAVISCNLWKSLWHFSVSFAYQSVCYKSWNHDKSSKVSISVHVRSLFVCLPTYIL